MIKNDKPTSKEQRKLVRRMILVLLAVGAVCCVVVWYMRWDRPGGGEALPTALRSAAGLEGKRKWSAEVVPYPGYPIYEGRRAWSHLEIAQRHKILVLRDLPDYVTELRGGGAIKETAANAAGWFFVVPQKHLKEFEDYLVDIGVPREALRHAMRKDRPGRYYIWDGTPPEVPATQLLFGTTQKAMGEGELMGMPFGLASETYTYYLLNPNLARATACIKVAWKTGNVQITEMPRDPDDD